MPSEVTDDEARGRPARSRDEAARRYRELAPRAPERGFDLFELFQTTGEIEMEIGFGRGLFLLQRAVVAPQALLLGIEIKKKLAYGVAERVKRLELTRVRVMAGDVRSVLPGIEPAGAIARAFMHFPDPWWKKRHAKRRLLSAELLDQLARLLRSDGEFFLQTDVEERAEEMLAELRAHTGFTLAGDGLIPSNPYGARSNREERAIADGLPVYRILARRRA